MSGAQQFAYVYVDKRVAVLDWDPIWCETSQCYDLTAPAIFGYAQAVLGAGIRNAPDAEVEVAALGSAVLLSQKANAQGVDLTDEEAVQLVRSAFRLFVARQSPELPAESEGKRVLH